MCPIGGGHGFHLWGRTRQEVRRGLENASVICLGFFLAFLLFAITVATCLHVLIQGVSEETLGNILTPFSPELS